MEIFLYLGFLVFSLYSKVMTTSDKMDTDNLNIIYNFTSEETFGQTEVDNWWESSDTVR